VIINPYTNKHLMVPYVGTHILPQDFGLIGTVIPDLHTFGRNWCVQAVYAPFEERALSGLRTKLVDEKNFVTFINQMDLEVLIGIGRPGTKCKWSGRTYNDPTDRDFYGMCCDEDDLLDDLYDRELLLRAESPTGMLDQNTEMVRRVHREAKVDIEEYYLLLWDADPETGISPDIRMTTVEKRWVCVERSRARWEDVP